MGLPSLQFVHDVTMAVGHTEDRFPSRRWPAAYWLVAVGLLAVATGCEYPSRAAAGASPQDGMPVAYFKWCSGERVTKVALSELPENEVRPAQGPVGPVSPSTVLWRIDAAGGRRLSQVTIGEVPPGFRVITPLRVPLPADRWLTVAFVYRHGGEEDASFRLSTLRPRLVEWNGKEVSVDEFHRQAPGCGLFTDGIGVYLDGHPTIRWLAILFGGGLVAGIAALVAAVWISRRHRPPRAAT
jgi:hypothetical protein